MTDTNESIFSQDIQSTTTPRKLRIALVTGCAGFIGSNFCRVLHDMNPDIKIVGIDNFCNSSKETLYPFIEFHEGTITDIEFLKSVFDQYQFDGVFHFAAIPQVELCQKDPLMAFETNVKGTHNILDIISRIAETDESKLIAPKLIFSSSAAVYGNTDKVPVEETDEAHPAGFYGMHKLQCEELIKQYVMHKNVDAVALRYFNVYGPGQRGDSAYATVIAKWCSTIANAIENLDAPELLSTTPKIRIDGDGTQSRDFIYIDSIVEANLFAFAKGKSGQVYNIASGTELSLLDLKEIFEGLIAGEDSNLPGKTLEVDFRPAREGDIKRSLASVTKAREDFGFEGAGDLKADIASTLRWWNILK